MRTRALPTTARDCFFLAGLVGLSAILYTGGLGFYSDDWAFLRILETTDDRSFFGLLRSLYDGDVFIRQRPVQVVYLVGVYSAFGLDPLGYHIVNAVVLAAATAVFYLVLRGLEQPRGLAVAVAAVYAVMPNYASDRFWLAAHQATLSVLFLLVSTLAALRSLHAHGRAKAALTLLSVAALALSGLAYEVTIPLLTVMLGLVAYRAHGLKPSAHPPRGRSLFAFLGASVITLAAVVVFKAGTSVRVGIDQGYDNYLRDLVVGTLRVDLGVYGLGLPYVVSWVVRNAADARVLALGAVAAGAVAAYVYRAQCAEPREARLLGRRYIWTGLATMALGYAIFVVPTVVSFSSASLGNRIRIAAALGTAAVLVGFVALLASLLRNPRARRGVFAGGVGLLCGSDLVVTNTLARFWTSAYREQREIVRHVLADVPRLTAGSTVILDGVCLERGGAYVFTGHRDVRGVLTIRYRQPALKASAITNPPEILARGLAVHTFGIPDFFPYGDSLIVYNVAQHQAHRLVDREHARRYFQRSGFRPREDCLPGFSWRGEAPPLD